MTGDNEGPCDKSIPLSENHAWNSGFLSSLNFEMTNVVKRTTRYQSSDRYNNNMHTLPPPWNFGGYVFMIMPIDS